LESRSYIRGALVSLALAAFIVSGGAIQAALREGDPHVYLTREQAFAIILPGADTIAREIRRLSPEGKARVERRSGRRMASDTAIVWIGRKNGDTIGYAMILEEIGLRHPITFGVGLRPDGRLVDCVVMVFRESRGSEIRDARFRRQLIGKAPSDPIRLNRDVINITGATYSSRAATDAIRKAMGIWTELYR
jgi:Na+-translocating ferredoxin:NAD+ oxidoreductase RnfG subunit